MFIQNALLFGFAFSCVSAGLPKTEANWQHVASDLKKIEILIQVSIYISHKVSGIIAVEYASPCVWLSVLMKSHLKQ